jgi:hypothetical protein
MGVISSLFLLAPLLAQAELIDQIAVVVDKSIIKDSDIRRDICLTQFLDNEPLRIDLTEKKNAAGRLIDQTFLREEIQIGGYPQATEQVVNSAIAGLENTRFHSEAALQTALKQYDLDESELREQLRWQLTVLQFIDSRFKTAVIVQDSTVDAYYREHLSVLKKSAPKASAEELRLQARNILEGEAVNRLLDSWLQQKRKEAKITFLEGGLT